jgi:gliding motility-associated-like protein
MTAGLTGHKIRVLLGRTGNTFSSLVGRMIKRIFTIFLFTFIFNVIDGQTFIDSIIYTTSREDFTFDCGEANPIDLNKVVNTYLSSDNGYWGDIDGNRYNWNVIYPALITDTGWHKYYFHFTSGKNYCGIKEGGVFILNLYIGFVGCLDTITAGELDNFHYFCYGSNVDMNPMFGRQTYEEPVTISELLFRNSRNPIKWGLGGDWVDITVYSDRGRTDSIGDGNKGIDLFPQNGAYDSTYYILIHHPDGEYIDSMRIVVYEESKLEIFYNPDIFNKYREYDIDDYFTISVDTSEYNFQYFTYILNNKILNTYYLGGDTTKNEIKISAMAFSGLEDIIEIIVTDNHNCIVRNEYNVEINVPFPNVFTPDGDGINDIFLGGDKYRNREFHLSIINRWGNLLYSGNSGWDGTYRGHKVPPGTYLFAIELRLSDGSIRTVKGTVALIRQSLY